MLKTGIDRSILVKQTTDTHTQTGGYPRSAESQFWQTTSDKLMIKVK